MYLSTVNNCTCETLLDTKHYPKIHIKQSNNQNFPNYDRYKEHICILIYVPSSWVDYCLVRIKEANLHMPEQYLRAHQSEHVHVCRLTKMQMYVHWLYIQIISSWTFLPVWKGVQETTNPNDFYRSWLSPWLPPLLTNRLHSFGKMGWAS